jgi:hypothetical protein
MASDLLDNHTIVTVFNSGKKHSLIANFYAVMLNLKSIKILSAHVPTFQVSTNVYICTPV